MAALFCLALKSALQEIQEGLPDGAVVLAYLDDIYLVCDRDDSSLLFRRTQEILARLCHIDVNLGKLVAWSKAPLPSPLGLDAISLDAWKAGKPQIDRGIKILGTPIGSPAFVESKAKEAVEEKAQLLNFLPKLPSLQSAWLLLYFCAVPRINHLLRTVPPELARSFAQDHDNSIQTVFRHSFAIPEEPAWDASLHRISYEMWARQSKLPLRLGGCGLRSSLRVSSAAYWASWADSLRGICERFPDVGNRTVGHLTTLQATPFPGLAPRCILQVELAGTWCESQGWDSRPTWADLAAGLAGSTMSCDRWPYQADASTQPQQERPPYGLAQDASLRHGCLCVPLVTLSSSVTCKCRLPCAAVSALRHHSRAQTHMGTAA